MPLPTLRESCLEILDHTRGISPILDLRRYDVSIVIRQWTGSRPGQGTSTITPLPFLVDNYKYRPKVRLLTTKEIIASNGLYVDGDYLVGRITPQYTSLDGYVYGYIPDDLRPIVTSQPREIFFKMIGPGLESQGSWFSTVEVSVERNLHYTFVIRKTAQKVV